jgi:gamma-glutamyltranspeptidase/glutathione hydrolase
MVSAVTRANAARSERGMVVTVHPIATDAAVEVMRQGGNAVDAAVTAALMLGVVDGHNSGIGGGCFMLIRTAGGEIIALDGRETAPAAAMRDLFIRDGKADTRLSQVGALASGVPGSLAVFDHAVTHFGKKRLAELLAPSAKVAEEGFPIDAVYARKLREVAADLATFPESKRILLKEDGQPCGVGEIIRQPELARTYREIAEKGIDHFYRGEFAGAVDQWMKQNGGILTAEDFAKYQMKTREPLVTRYRGHTIVGFPPPSSGGVHVGQILSMLERFDLKALDEVDRAMRVNVTVEAMKLAFADRAHWLGDPDFVPVPRGLIDPAYTAELAKKIDPKRATTVPSHGTPPRAEEDVFGKHTTHIAAADAEGNWVAITTSLNTAFGSKVIVPGTGVLLNNHMDDFSIQPGVPNSFKLVGADANAIAPLKRPLSSMSPTLVLKDDQPIMTVGAAGGPTIITQVVLAISNYLDLDHDLDAALRRPRFHHQWKPDELRIEITAGNEVIARLEKMGHPIKRVPPVGATQAIVRPAADEPFIGVSEPRLSGKAAGP